MTNEKIGVLFNVCGYVTEVSAHERVSMGYRKKDVAPVC